MNETHNTEEFDKNTLDFFQELSVTSYGEETLKNPQILLLCNHSGKEDPFLPTFEDAILKQSQSISQKDLRTYCEIEKDSGSSELAHKIGKTLGKKIYSLRTDVVEVPNVPRGIIDTNRVIKHAIRNTFQKNKKNTELVESLLQIYWSITNKIRKLVKSITPTGILLDIHTMSPNEPSGKGSEVFRVELTPNNMTEYNKAYSELNGQDRPEIDVITATQDGEILATPDLTQRLKKHYKTHKIHHEENKPYPIPTVTLSHELLKACQKKDVRSGILDVSKRALTNGNEFNLANPNLCDKAIYRIALPTAYAIIECLSYKEVNIKDLTRHSSLARRAN